MNINFFHKSTAHLEVEKPECPQCQETTELHYSCRIEDNQPIYYPEYYFICPTCSTDPHTISLPDNKYSPKHNSLWLHATIHIDAVVTKRPVSFMREILKPFHTDKIESVHEFYMSIIHLFMRIRQIMTLDFDYDLKHIRNRHPINITQIKDSRFYMGDMLWWDTLILYAQESLNLIGKIIDTPDPRNEFNFVVINKVTDKQISKVVQLCEDYYKGKFQKIRDLRNSIFHIKDPRSNIGEFNNRVGLDLFIDCYNAIAIAANAYNKYEGIEFNIFEKLSRGSVHRTLLSESLLSIYRIYREEQDRLFGMHPKP